MTSDQFERMGLPAFKPAHQIEETGNQAPRLGEASMDRSHVLSQTSLQEHGKLEGPNHSSRETRTMR